MSPRARRDTAGTGARGIFTERTAAPPTAALSRPPALPSEIGVRHTEASGGRRCDPSGPLPRSPPALPRRWAASTALLYVPSV